MKKRFVIVLSLCLIASFVMAACGSSASTNTNSTQSSAVSSNASVDISSVTTDAYTGDKYVNSGSDFSIKTVDLPTGYMLVSHDKFVEAFREFRMDGGSVTTASSYEEIAALFGDDGIKMEGIVYDGYAYYSWYSDQDYTDETKTHILITFKNNNGNLTYFAYSTEGINIEDVTE